MSYKTPITLIYGDGIGPEIMTAVLKILQVADVAIEPDVIEVGKKVYLAKDKKGIPKEAWESLKHTKLLLKAPITTPQGGGYKSLNVILRQTLGLYANVRPCRALASFIPTHFPEMDLIVIRENEEDLYAGIEYQHTQDVCESMKLISHQGSEKVIRFAFNYARQYNRRKVTCLMKDNIMKMTDGLFHRVFKQVAREYPDLEANSLLIDIGTARIANHPEAFDVIITQNLYGDIISDVTAEIAGSVGLAGSANIGDEFAMFEAMHGSAPDIAGSGIANPSGLLNAAIMMLVHIGQYDKASLIENAWLATLEDGIHTADIYRAGYSQKRVNTDDFVKAVITRLGKKPHDLHIANYRLPTKVKTSGLSVSKIPPILVEKKLVGVDIYINLPLCGPKTIAQSLQHVSSYLKLNLIMNRGINVWPNSIG